jgi:chromatin assembly factor 1 subunit B
MAASPAPRWQGLVSGGVDGSCIVWNIAKARVQQTMRDHEHYVQGVAWDPRGEFVVSVSCDRSARIYSNRTRKGAPRDFACTAAISKTRCSSPDSSTMRALADAGAAISGGTPAADASGVGAETSGSENPAVETAAAAAPGSPAAGAETPLLLPIDEAKRAKEREVRLFLDDAVPSFFRRPAWSPDGSFLLLPCGQYTDTPHGRPAPATLVLARSDLSSPCAFLPGPAKPVVAVRCCPVMFELRPPAASEERAAAPDVPGAPAGEAPAGSWLPLGYRVVWAVATLDAILVYDSQQPSPLLLATSLHYAALTDVAWLPGGQGLITSSSDGYCTILMLEEGHLGTPLPPEKLPACMQPGVPAQAAGKPPEHPDSGRAADLAEAPATEPAPLDDSHDAVDAPSAIQADVGVSSAPPLDPSSRGSGCYGTSAAGADTAGADRPAASPAPLPTDATLAGESSGEGQEKIIVAVEVGAVAAGAVAPIEVGMTHSDGLQVKKKPKRAVLVEVHATGA